jgi:hypothetical protein
VSLWVRGTAPTVWIVSAIEPKEDEMKSTQQAAVFEHNYGEEAFDENNKPIPGSDSLYGVWLVERGEVEDEHGQVEEGWVRNPEGNWGEFPTEEDATTAANSAGLQLVAEAHWEPHDDGSDD